MKFFVTAIFFLFSFCVQAQIEKDIPKRPSPPKLVNDLTNTLTRCTRYRRLENKLVAYDDSTSNQVAIVIVPILQGYDLSEYGLAIGREWGIGGKEFNNGVLILVAKDDRKVRIEVGYGLEGAIPDITAKSIIDNSITPNFKEENYYRGLDLATDDIIKAAAGEYKAPAELWQQKEKRGWLWSYNYIHYYFFSDCDGIGGGGRGSGGTMSGAGWIIGSMLGRWRPKWWMVGQAAVAVALVVLAVVVLVAVAPAVVGKPKGNFATRY